jgi:hypothetical protein
VVDEETSTTEDQTDQANNYGKKTTMELNITPYMVARIRRRNLAEAWLEYRSVVCVQRLHEAPCVNRVLLKRLVERYYGKERYGDAAACQSPG